MAKRIISTQEAPAALGYYSQATATDATLYCSGQIGIRPDTGELEHGVEAQARQAFRNLEAVIAEAGRSTAQVMKLTIFLASINDFALIAGLMAWKTTLPSSTASWANSLKPPIRPVRALLSLRSRRAPSLRSRRSLILPPDPRVFGQ